MFVEYPKALYDDRNEPFEYITVNSAEEEAIARDAGYTPFGELSEQQEKPKRGRPRKVKDGD